ncbi:MAG TPA: TolC family outer membrane protein [Xanthobacteraceae bacterium]|nr:TolC family outer membrane protein [Xanthobacteraceae bacterium]
MRVSEGSKLASCAQLGAVLLIIAASIGGPGQASAQTLPAALVHAYQNNPQLNAQRAQVRVTDEAVPQALSGYRPRLSVTASAARSYSSTTSRSSVPSLEDPSRLVVVPPERTLAGEFTPYTLGVTGTQTLFNGFQTANRTRLAEGQVSAAREALRVMEQTVLLAAATVYMDLLRDTAIADVQRSNVRVLNETLRQTRDRFNVGEVTRTDVAQSEAQLAAGQFQLSNAEANLTTTRANFRRVIGIEAGALTPAAPVERLAPRTLAAALQIGLDANPNVTSAMYGIDVANLQVKINEGALFPTVTLNGSAQRLWDSSLTQVEQTTWSIGSSVTIPIYQGGGEYSLIRQSKESLTQQRLNLEQVRDQTRQSIAQAWGVVQATKAQIESAQAQVRSSETALNGVREEARVGQRTTLDVLNAQQALVNARVTLVTAQRDRVVASYNLLNAIGILSPLTLGLATPIYDPRIHYHQVRDSWVGLRTPDGK